MGKDFWLSHLQSLSSPLNPSCVPATPLLPFTSVNTGTSYKGSGFTLQNPPPQPPHPQPQVPSLRRTHCLLPSFPDLLGWGGACFQWEDRSKDARPSNIHIFLALCLNMG